MASLIDSPCNGKSCDRICEMAHALALGTKGMRNGPHTAAITAGRDLARAEFARLTAVQVSVRDKRPIPTVDGLCTP